ncbi:MAG TPA: pilus assembly protein TadG-related protein [Acidimicrobiia bacterium]|nr:pilus assembly protein TadG-related protein [Acidimicrobiia bacterium]
MVHLKHRARRRDESGIVLVLSVILLVVMLGTAAIVVDLGLANSNRRRMQSGADAAALGAAQDLPVVATADVDAKNLAQTNLSDLPIAAGWGNVAQCPGPTLAVVSATTNCISYDGAFMRIRVRVPRQTFNTLFGHILGFNTLGTSTVADAGIVSVGNNGLIPFVLFAGFSGTNACLDSGGAGSSCQKPAGYDGFFNDLDMYQYGNATLGTDTLPFGQRCNTSGGGNARLTGNLAMGADHIYTDDPNNTAGTINDDCGPPPIAGPNEIGEGTGNNSAFDRGLWASSDGSITDGKGGRLLRAPTSWPTCGSYPSTSVGFDTCWPTVMVANHPGVDNRPLWTFIDPSLDGSASVPSSCWPSAYPNDPSINFNTNPVAAKANVAAADLLMKACLDAYNAPGAAYPPLFTRNSGPTEQPIDILDIQSSPRFNYVPQVRETDPHTNCADCLHIRRFRAVFLQEVMGNNISSLDSEPGPWNVDDSSNKTAEGAIGWVIPDNALPQGLRGKPVNIGVNAVIQLVG